MAQIYLVRHGQASFGSQNYDQLSALGAEQAAALGRWWTERGLQTARIVTGAMQRHRQTADACMAQMTTPEAANPERWQCDARFNEYHHHEVLVRHHPEFDDPAVVKHFLMNTPNGKQAFQDLFTAAVARWISGLHDSDYTETWKQFQQRCVAAFREQIMMNDDARQIVIFTSGGTIAAICQHVLDFPDERFAPFNWSLVNTGVTRIHLAHGADQQPRLALAYLNNFSHLEVLNQTSMITYV